MTHAVSTTTEEYRLELNVDTLTIDSTSRIDVTGKGYLGGYSGDNNSPYGRTLGNTTDGGSYNYAGGSYGGLGYSYSSYYPANKAYGDYKNPNELGSGSGGYGNGGGLVRINATSITLDGAIYANGSDADSYYSGGSGGGVYINTGILTGAGEIMARGGDTPHDHIYMGGGGGGRIAVYYNDISGFDTSNIKAHGGDNPHNDNDGGAGTVYLKASTQEHGDLIVDNNNLTTTEYSTPLISIGPGTITDLTEITLTNTARNWKTDNLIGILLNPNSNQPNFPPIVYPITQNDSITITFDPTDEINVLFVAQVGDTYIGEHFFDNIIITNGARVQTTDNINYNTIDLTGDITGGILDANNIHLEGNVKKNPLVMIAKKFFKKIFTPIPEVSINPAPEFAKSDHQIEESRVDKKSIKTTSSIEKPSDTKKAVMLASIEPIFTGAGIKEDFAISENKPVVANMLPDVAPLKKLDETDILVLPVLKEKKTAQVQKKVENTPHISATDPKYTYDLNGNRLTMTDPTGTTQYEYDALNRLTKIINQQGDVTSFAYDAISRRTGMTQANGVVTTYGYDPAGRILLLVSRFVATNISTYSYTYDKVGNQTSMTDIDGVHNFIYDQLNRLVQATHPQPANPAENFAYDPVGNRQASHLSSDYSYDNADRMLSDNQYLYSYDANGNLVGKTNRTTGEVTSYVYDAQNWLIKVITPTSTIRYQYDALGRRILKDIDGTIIKYVYDNQNIILELDSNNNVIARYTNSLDIDDQISMDRDTNGDGTIDATYYYHKNVQASVTSITDNSGNVVQSYTYDSFGDMVDKTGNLLNLFTYTGRQWDKKTGLYYYRARYYDAAAGRFLQEDPIGFVEGINHYVYVDNNPAKYIDPMGLYRADGYGGEGGAGSSAASAASGGSGGSGGGSGSDGGGSGGSGGNGDSCAHEWE